MKEYKNDKPEHSNFGENLIRLRKLAGISQKELAEKLAISQRMLSHYEHRATCVPLEMIPRIAESLNVPVEFLFRRTSQKHIEEVDLTQLNLRIIKNIKKMLNLPPKDRKFIFSMIRLYSDVDEIRETQDTEKEITETKPEDQPQPIPDKVIDPPKKISIVSIQPEIDRTPDKIIKKPARKKRQKKNKTRYYLGKNQLAALLANQKLTIVDIAKKLKTEPEIVRKYIHKYDL